MKFDPKEAPLWNFTIDSKYTSYFKDNSNLHLIVGNEEIKTSILTTGGEESCVKVNVDMENNVYCLALIQGNSVIGAMKNDKGPDKTFMLIKLNKDGKLLWLRQIGDQYHEKSIKNDFGLSYSSPLFENNNIEEPIVFKQDLTPVDFAIGEEQIIVVGQTKSDFVYDEDLAFKDDDGFLVDKFDEKFDVNYPIFFSFDFSGNLKFIYQQQVEREILQGVYDFFSQHQIKEINYNEETKSFLLAGEQIYDTPDYSSMSWVDGSPSNLKFSIPYFSVIDKNFKNVLLDKELLTSTYLGEFKEEYGSYVPANNEKPISLINCTKILSDAEKNLYCLSSTTIPFGKGVEKDTDKNGYPFQDGNIQLIKYNHHGYLEWARQIDKNYQSQQDMIARTEKEEKAIDMAMLNDEIYILAQTKGDIEDVYNNSEEDSEDGDVFLIKYSLSGEVIWAKQWGKHYFGDKRKINPTSLHTHSGRIFMSGSVGGEHEFSCFTPQKGTPNGRVGFIIDLTYHIENKIKIEDIVCPALPFYKVPKPLLSK